MADGLNRVMLLGNLGADPELRFTQGGQAVLNMRLAINESYLDKDKVRRERVEWVAVVVWGKRGEALAKILTKGSSVFVEGSLRSSSYDDRDGNKRYKTEINANNIVLTGGRGRGGGEDPGGGGGYDAGGGEDAGGGGGGGGAPNRPPNAVVAVVAAATRLAAAVVVVATRLAAAALLPAVAARLVPAAPPAGPPADAPADDFDGGGYGGGSDDDIPF